MHEESWKAKLMPKTVDVLIGFSDWFGNHHPIVNEVVVFDKDDTLISSRKEGRVLHQHMVDQVLMPLVHKKPELALVLFTLSGDKALSKDIAQFPQVFKVFDLMITGDNLSSETIEELINFGKLDGDPLQLEAERILKPVDRMFAGYPVVLIDDWVDTIWSSVTSEVHGLQAPALEQCTMSWAEMMYSIVAHKLQNQQK